MADEEKSPAVASLEPEQGRQNSQEVKDGLDAALEGTFPASDPVSMTATSIPAGRTAAEHMIKAKRERDNASSQGTSFINDAIAIVRANPLRAVGVVAALAFIYGANR